MSYRLVSALSSLAAVALLGSVAAPCFAVPIEFTHKASGGGNKADGTLNNISFGPVGFTITAFGDTDKRQDIKDAANVVIGYFIDHISASIFIPGQGNIDFLTSTRTFVNNDRGVVGFAHAGAGGIDLFDGPKDGVFNTWDMLTSTKPINGDGELTQWSSLTVNTSRGVLVFDDDFRNAQFQADVRGAAAVPEPGSLALICLALAAFGWMRRKALS